MFIASEVFLLPSIYKTHEMQNTLIVKMIFFTFFCKIVSIFTAQKVKRLNPHYKMKKLAFLSLIALTLAACFSNSSESSQGDSTSQIDNSTETTSNELVVADKIDKTGGSGIAARESDEINQEEPTSDNTEPVEYENDGKVIELTDKTFNTLCIDMETDEIMCPVPLIIDYNATWCGPCRQIAPILAKLQKEYGNKMQVFSVDIDKCPNAAEYFEFDAIPTLVFVDMEGNCEQTTGSLSESALRSKIKKYLKID